MTITAHSLYRPCGVPRKPAIILIFTALLCFPGDVAAQGLPAQNGSMIPVALLWIGSLVLGLVMVYGILRNRSRTRADKQLTERATKDLYAEEERERVKSGSS